MNSLEINLVIPDLWQQEAVHALRAGRDVVVNAPTGAGKTYIFELFQSSLKGQAVFTVPTRALANDKLAEWQARGWDVGIMTGDLAYKLDAKIVVATLETQKAKLLRREGPRLLAVDEYQMIADPIRGVNYELALALASPDTQLLLLSGSVANPQDIVAWLKRIGRDAALITHKERPVPLNEVDLLALPNKAPAQVRGFWPRLIANALRAGLGPILVFAPRRNAAEELAQSFATLIQEPLALSPAQEALAGTQLSKLLHKRVAFHHSGLSYALRAGVIEPLAKNGQLSVVVATMGLAAGINFSMRSVLVTDTRYMAGNLEHHVQPDELLQMFGRAGRRGLDEAGFVLVAPQQPRLHDGRPRQLKRSPQVDWPTLIAVMKVASDRGEQPFDAAIQLNEKLYSIQKIPLGVEHSRETGTMPCGLCIDMERARFARRTVVEMQNSAGEWEPLSVPEETPLGEVFIHDRGSWRPALQVAPMLDGIGFGNLCRLGTGRSRTYGREIPLGVLIQKSRVSPPVHAHNQSLPAHSQTTITSEHISPAKWLRRKLHLRSMERTAFENMVIRRLPELTGGGTLFDLITRGNLLAARLDFSQFKVPAIRDTKGKALFHTQSPHPTTHSSETPDPKLAFGARTRPALPAPCRGCPELNRFCKSVEIVQTPAHAWRRLGLIDAQGVPTRRGIIFSFFNNGEGLAVAAALEDESYPCNELVFDLANLRAGHRFAGDQSPFSGRLGALCQQVFKRADDPGYLEMGVPPNYGAGAAEVIREVVEHATPRHKLLTEWLRPGDIERAIIEWRSLLRHLLFAPDYDWSRWRELKAAAASFAEATPSPSLTALPPVLGNQLRNRETPAWHGLC